METFFTVMLLLAIILVFITVFVVDCTGVEIYRATTAVW